MRSQPQGVCRLCARRGGWAPRRNRPQALRPLSVFWEMSKRQASCNVPLSSDPSLNHSASSRIVSRPAYGSFVPGPKMAAAPAARSSA